MYLRLEKWHWATIDITLYTSVIVHKTIAIQACMIYLENLLQATLFPYKVLYNSCGMKY